MHPETIYRIALTMIPQIGPVTAKYLVSYCGSAEAVFHQKAKELIKIPGVGETLAKAVVHANVLDEAAAELDYTEKQGITLLYYLENEYPARLKHFDDCPILLYYKGTANVNHHRTVAIVGTRKPSDYGTIQCEKLVEQLQPYNVQIISGLAYGIDAAAHHAALNNNMETLGIVGNSLEKIYPPAHKKLSEKILHHGGLLSQFKSGTGPDAPNFPMRNKIIAALADVIVVIESKRSGGSMITAEMGNTYNKDVFALPGKTTDPYSEGCNKLIKQHKANLLESANDIAYIMRWEEMDKQQAVQGSLFVELDPEEQSVIDCILSLKEAPIDSISYRTGYPGSKLASILLSLEFKGLIVALPGKKYVVR